MSRRSVLGWLFISALGASIFLRPAHPARQDALKSEHTEWVARTLEEMETIQPGKTRKDLLEVFTTEGGLSTVLKRTYVSRACPYFKVDVEFKAVGRPEPDDHGRVTLVEDDGDLVVSISRPYLQFAVVD
jgi:hypothetical protein